MTVDAPPGEKQLDRRAALKCQVGRLGVDREVANYVRAIAGAHYNPASDVLRISNDQHRDAASNRRLALEQLVALVQQGGALKAQHGPFRRHVRFPPYTH